MTKARTGCLTRALLAVVLTVALNGARADTKPASPSSSSPVQILPGTSSKEPVSVDADKLVYYDKDRKAIYTGNVVVIQGDTKMTCSAMTVFLDRSPAQESAESAAAQSDPSPTSRIK